MIVEQIDHRILGALRLLDPTTQLPLAQPFAVRATRLQPLNNNGTPNGNPIALRPGDALFRRNSRGDIVILAAPGFSKYTTAFDTIPNTSRAALGIELKDSTGTYLPLVVNIPLPRDGDSTHSAQADSVFQPQTVAPFLAPSASTEVSWSVVRATVRERVTQNNAEAGGARLPWTSLRVRDAQDNTLLAQGMADARGEALLAIPGVLITMPANDGGAVLTRELEVRLEGAFTPQLKKISDAEVLARENPNPNFIPSFDAGAPFAALRVNPRGAAAANTIKIAAGRSLVVELWLALA